MKKFLCIISVLLLTSPALAEYTSKYPLTMTQNSQSSEKTKIYSSGGSSYQGFVKPIGANRVGVYNKCGQKEKTYKVKGNKLVEDKYVWH